MGSGVENKIRPVLAHHGIDPVGIADGADEHRQVQLRVIPPQFHLNVIGVILIDIENDQLLGVGPGDLTAQLAADAAAAASDHDHLSRYEVQNLVQVHLNGLPAQQILRIHLAQLADADLPIDHLENAGQDLNLAAGGGADVQDLLPGLGGGAGNGHNDLADIVLLYRLGDFLPGTHDGHAAQPLSHLYRIVVNHTHQIVPNVAAVGKLQCQGSSCVSRADYHYVFQPRRMGRMAELLLHRQPHPVGEPDRHAAHIAQQQPHHHTGPRHQHAVEVEHCHADDCQYTVSAGDAKNF